MRTCLICLGGGIILPSVVATYWDTEWSCKIGENIMRLVLYRSFWFLRSPISCSVFLSCPFLLNVTYLFSSLKQELGFVPFSESLYYPELTLYYFKPMGSSIYLSSGKPELWQVTFWKSLGFLLSNFQEYQSYWIPLEKHKSFHP